MPVEIVFDALTGAPQDGQLSAFVLTRFPHSRHFAKAIARTGD